MIYNHAMPVYGLGHHWPASKAPFEWRFTGRPYAYSLGNRQRGLAFELGPNWPQAFIELIFDLLLIQVVILCKLGNFSCHLVTFFQNLLLQKILSGTLSEWQMIWEMNK